MRPEAVTLYPELTITGLIPPRTSGVIILPSTVHNQKEEWGLEGEMKLLVRKRPAQSA